MGIKRTYICDICLSEYDSALEVSDSTESTDIHIGNFALNVKIKGESNLICKICLDGIEEFLPSLRTFKTCNNKSCDKPIQDEREEKYDGDLCYYCERYEGKGGIIHRRK